MKTGVVVWSAAYTPFGKAEVAGSSTQTNNFRFPGQYYDAETGLHYNWHRYYDPRTGRYVTADPIGLEKGDNHLYGYVRNNPIVSSDKFGLFGDDGDWVPIINPFLPILPAFPNLPESDGWPWYGGWPWNGTLWPGYDMQDDECSPPVQGLNNKCTKKCCEDHDDCYKRFGCNFSSWAPIGLPGPCKLCNIEAAICVMKNKSKGECDECD